MVPPILGNLHEKIFLTGAYSVGDWCLSLAKVYMQMLSGHTSPSGTASAITGPLCAPSFIRFKGAPRGQSRQEDTRSATNVNSEACKISQIRISRPFYLIHPHSSSLPFWAPRGSLQTAPSLHRDHRSKCRQACYWCPRPRAASVGRKPSRLSHKNHGPIDLFPPIHWCAKIAMFFDFLLCFLLCFLPWTSMNALQKGLHDCFLRLSLAVSN